MYELSTIGEHELMATLVLIALELHIKASNESQQGMQSLNYFQ